MERIKLFFYKIFKEYKCFVTFLLVVINLLIYAGMFFDYGGLDFDSMYMYEKGAIFTGGKEECEWYRLVTAMFLHFDLEHILNNMLMLALIGSMIERIMGSVTFAGVYFLGGISGNVLTFHMHEMNNELVVAAGASGAIFAVSGALILIFLMIRNRIKQENTIGQRMLLFGVLLLVQCFGKDGVDNYAHFGGLLSGVLLAAIFMIIKSKFQKTNDYKYEERNDY